MFQESRSNQSCWQGTAGTVGRGRLAAPSGPIRLPPVGRGRPDDLGETGKSLEFVTSVSHQDHSLILSLSEILCPDTS